VLFLVFGSSGSGKTFALDELRRRGPDFDVHDFDELGVPSDADKAWRQRTNEAWVQRALDAQARGVDLLLAAQSPLGELLATPSAPLLDGIAGCLLDCSDEVRVARLRARPEWRGASHLDDLPAFLSWAAWMREHVWSPTDRLDALRDDAWEEMRWERLDAIGVWRVEVIDTTELPVEQVAEALLAWVERERASSRKIRA
jgi:hypothetical protein